MPKISRVARVSLHNFSGELDAVEVPTLCDEVTLSDVVNALRRSDRNWILHDRDSIHVRVYDLP
jgi:hypothetical protein